jgi:hypothetical protein
MNIVKAKISFLLFVLFVVFYITRYSPKMYVISFLLTTFFILLEKTNIIKNNTLPFKIPYKSIIIIGLITIGLFYLYIRFFKREGFVGENEKNKMDDVQMKNLEDKINNRIDTILLNKQNDVKGLLRRNFEANVESQLNIDKQDLKFNDRKYKIQTEIEESEDKNAKKQTPLDKKNLLLFKQNLVKQIPIIIEELKLNTENILYNKDTKDYDKVSYIDKLLELIRSSFTILNKDDRMIYVGTSSLIISFALMLFDISL